VSDVIEAVNTDYYAGHTLAEGYQVLATHIAHAEASWDVTQANAINQVVTEACDGAIKTCVGLSVADIGACVAYSGMVNPNSEIAE
jgi:hypothetical protein